MIGLFLATETDTDEAACIFLVAGVYGAKTPSSTAESAAPSPVIEPPTNDQPPAPSNSDDNGM
ncbi:hypothetical protein SADUNF_Sadunf02G0078000 [Salix dunnii]|uniref:Uncharacterized protein n=1 Tax=Salix dunnii TaxID=1413687 RepID=A0A835TJ43_9ROSI|nr:hypothetical protein SADUNF_Sadunf02G0078000 [Salix dunnii]